MEIKRRNRTHVEVIVIGVVALYFIGGRLIKATENSEEPSWPYILFQAFALLLMGGLLTRSIIHLTKKTPALIITSEGIVDNISLANAGKIDGANIEGFSIGKVSGTDHLIIKLKDHKSVLSKLSGFKQRMLETIMKKHGTPIAVNLKLLKIDPDELMEVLESNFPNSSTTESS
jgi:hypothetical protein